ncbi:hypothetical protein C1H46_030445 [Malus baccata]|uniref:Uncharacterized protein n=1 Tax=Malus baccata TaxID=106549 RepID=A0A540LBZ0_MALBA|nr:hypothetical protein C1H46_030445 [Malus baccata]
MLCFLSFFLSSSKSYSLPPSSPVLLVNFFMDGIGLGGIFHSGFQVLSKLVVGGLRTSAVLTYLNNSRTFLILYN